MAKKLEDFDAINPALIVDTLDSRNLGVSVDDAVALGLRMDAIKKQIVGDAPRVSNALAIGIISRAATTPAELALGAFNLGTADALTKVADYDPRTINKVLSIQKRRKGGADHDAN